MNITTQIIKNISSKSDAEIMWQIYSDAFSCSADKSVQEQICYTKNSFLSAMTDEDYIKIITFVDGTPGGFVLLTNNIEKAKVTYISPAFFQKKWPVEFMESRIYFTTALAVKPEWQKKYRLFHYITPIVTAFIDQNDSIFIADHSIKSIPWLKDALIHDVRKAQSLGNLKTDTAEVEELDAQVYFAICLTKSS